MRTGDASAKLEGRWTELRPPTPQDLPFLYQLHTATELGFRFRFYGAIPSFEEFSRHVWDAVVAQWVVRKRLDGQPVGLVVLASADYRSGTAHFSVVADPSQLGKGLLMDAVGCFLSYVFWAFPFRLLYAEAIGDNLAQFQSGSGRLFELEGCRRESVWAAGRYQDLHLLVISRERWQQFGEPMRTKLMRSGSRGSEGPGRGMRHRPR